jgi:hypothetical protein
MFPVDVFKHLETGGNPGSFVHTRLTSPGTAAGNLSVTYQFTAAAVPAPPGWGLLGAGVGCALLSRVARRGVRG